MTLKYLIQKEFIQIRRNSFLPRLIVVFPIMIMCVMPWVMNMEVKNIVVDVVDNDHSTLSQQLVHEVEASHYFIFNGQKTSYQEALSEVEKSQADIIMVIPPNYEKDMVQGNSPQVLIAANAVNGTKGSIGSAYLSQIVMALGNNDHLLEQRIQSQAQSSIVNRQSSMINNLYNKHQNYKVYMIPALMAILMMMLCGFLPALNIVGEKEAGTIEQMNVTPVKKWQFILAKLIPYWMIALFVMTVCFILAWLIYGITCQGNLAWVYLIAMLLALFWSSFGLIISNYSDTMQQAIFVMWFFVVCLMLLSGLFTPTRSMPDWAYLTTYINPMHYFVDAIRTVFIRGGDLHSIWHQVVALACIAIFMGGWAVQSYRKNS
ncbi:MAG: ABC transporter permease [Bacteroidaceae bacterium]|nr:ABC transporter permease [Bacteroidaceae bacterium]